MGRTLAINDYICDAILEDKSYESRHGHLWHQPGRLYLLRNRRTEQLLGAGLLHYLAL